MDSGWLGTLTASKARIGAPSRVTTRVMRITELLIVTGPQLSPGACPPGDHLSPLARSGHLVADVLEPQLRVGGDELAHELHALRVVDDGDLDAVFGEPFVAAEEGGGFADDHVGDAELADQAAAVPARGQGGHHGGAAVAAAAAGVAEGRGLAVHGGVAVLDAAVAALAPEF